MDMIGHNRPPDAIATLLDELQAAHQPLADRLEEIRDAYARVPDDCDDDDTANNLADFIKSAAAFTKNAEAARVAAKEPFLAQGRAVDSFFKRFIDPIDRVKASLSQRLTAYQRRKADEERRRREEIARQERERAAEEARAAARLARIAADEESRRLAAEAADRAAAAQEAADAARVDASMKAADLSRTRTDLGARASLRTRWVFEIEDPEAIPRLYLSVNESAIRAAIRAATTADGKCDLKIPGVRVYASTISVVS